MPATFTPQRRAAVVRAIVEWYEGHGRELPWRHPATTPWGVVVSEFMLQQTPVARVVEPWSAWMRRWPTPADLAAVEQGDAVAAWGRLGYPRRAARLHQLARVLVAEHGGQVPSDPGVLLGLPGVGEYTAAAITSFAHRGRAVVLDTNVRRLLSRVEGGEDRPAEHLTVGERARGEAWLPARPATAAAWAVASMELGALVCTSSAPRCSSCPVSRHCRWFAAGSPATPTTRRRQSYEGTDRQCRGALLAVLRAERDGVERDALLSTWPDREQARRALASLVADSLVSVRPHGRLTL